MDIEFIYFTQSSSLLWELIFYFINLILLVLRYESITEQVTVPEEGSVSVNFTLMADDPQHWSSAYDFR